MEVIQTIKGYPLLPPQIKIYWLIDIVRRNVIISWLHAGEISQCSQGLGSKWDLDIYWLCTLMTLNRLPAKSLQKILYNMQNTCMTNYMWHHWIRSIHEFKTVKKKVNKQIVTEVLNNNHGSKKLKWKNYKILICWLIKGKHQRNPSKICWKEEPPTRMRSILAHAVMTQGSQMIKNNFLICWFMILYNWWVNPVSKPVFDQATEFHGSDKKIDGQFSAQPHSSLSNAYITVFG